jgi:hypothetical protein
MRQLIEDLISAMEYHVEQTRPIHSTTVALQAAREAFKSLSAQPAPTVQEPSEEVLIAGTAYTVPAAVAVELLRLHLTVKTAAQRQWVGLTDKEMYKLWLSVDEESDRMAFGEAVQAKLKEKNT